MLLCEAGQAFAELVFMRPCAEGLVFQIAFSRDSAKWPRGKSVTLPVDDTLTQLVPLFPHGGGEEEKRPPAARG